MDDKTPTRTHEVPEAEEEQRPRRGGRGRGSWQGPRADGVELCLC